MAEIPKALKGYIDTRVRRVAKSFGYDRRHIAQEFARLMQGQIVRIGGRTSCGGKVDPSWVEFCAWRECIKKARAMGIAIDETPVKHANGWATKAGGFWDENDYQIRRDK